MKKTTIELDDELYRQAKIRAAERGISLRELVQNAGGMQLVTFDKGFRRFVGVNTLILAQQPAVREEQPKYQVSM